MTSSELLSAEGSSDGRLAEAARSYLDQDDFREIGALLRVDSQLLDYLAAVLTRRARRGSVLGRSVASQHLRFLARARQDAAAVFPPDDLVIDPTCYGLVADRHARAEQEEERFDHAATPESVCASADGWTHAWADVLEQPCLQSAHPALLAALLNDAARADLRCFFAVGDVQRLHRARVRLEFAVALTPSGSPRAATRRSNLGLVLMELADDEAARDPESYRRQALGLLRNAARATVPGTAARADCLARLAQGRLQLYWATGRVAHLNAAVRELAPALEAAPVRSDVAHSLGAILRQRYAVRGRDEDLDVAVYLLAAADSAMPPDSPDRIRALVDLGVALLDRHRRGADADDLTRAGEKLGAAAAAATTFSPDRASALAHLSMCRYRLFETTGSLSALADALDLATQAARAPVVRSGERAACLLNLAAVTEETARQSADRRMLDEALATYREALDAAPVVAILWAITAGLGAAWRDRFALSDDPADLDRAVAVLGSAAAQVPAAALDYGRIVLALSLARLERHAVKRARSGDQTVERGAEPSIRVPEQGMLIDELQAAVDAVDRLARRRTPRVDRQRLNAVHLMLSLVDAEERRPAASIPALRRRLRRIRIEARLADPEMLLWVGRLWAGYAVADARWRDATVGYGMAVDTLRELARRQVDLRHGHWWLRTAGQFAEEAAFAGVRAGRRREAARLLETGRVVRMSDALSMQALRVGPTGEVLSASLVERLDAALRRVRAAERAALGPGLVP